MLGTVLLMALAVTGASAFGGGSSGQQPRASLTQQAGRFIPFRPAAGRPSLPPARRAVGIDVYAADRPGQLSPVVRGFPSRIYVPNSDSDTVDVIDPARFKVIDHFPVGGLPQHITPSFDLKTLWVDNDHTNELTPLDPATGRRGAPVPVTNPYNLYFTPDGQNAIVVAEALQRLDFRDPRTMKLKKSVAVPCAGVDHIDFSADGAYLIASCELASKMIKVDLRRQQVSAALWLPVGSSPQDVKLSPDGRVFYVADKGSGGVYLVDGERFRLAGFRRTGVGAHGLYVSRDSSDLYVTNRGAATVSVLSFQSRQVVRTWRIPGGGSPDMGGVSADGTVLWLTGRYAAEVYAISTRTGALLARIPVGKGPHGLAVYPQPGRYSLGHTGVFR